MKLQFSHHGVERTLNKHPAVQLALKRGDLTEAEAKLKPWFLRVNVGGRDRSFKLSNLDKDAIRGAKDILNGHRDRPEDFSAWLSDRAARRGVTLQVLAEDWFNLGLPDDGGHPRDQKAADQLKWFTNQALKWWGPRPALSITQAHMLDFAAWRRSKCAESGRGTGDRSVDLELAALSSMCQWAAAAQKVSSNPFADRPRFRRPEDIRHCHEFMPESDEQWHAVLNWFWTTQYNQDDLSNRYKAAELDLRTRVAGAWLAWCGLVGLRPEEPQYLFRYATLQSPPTSPDRLPPGTIFPTRDGLRKMKIVRTKHGQNPYVVIHAAAADFLDHWSRWLGANIKPAIDSLAQPWFPDPLKPSVPLCAGDFSILNKRLDDACVACGSRKLKPKGFGRAYYVRVRRSQGAADPAIACELGQTTNGELIRETYGNPDDMVGGALFDWLPEDDKQNPVATAWKLLLPAEQSNIITL